MSDSHHATGVCAIEAICGPSQFVKIDDGTSVHVRTAREWLDLARRDFEAQRSETGLRDSVLEEAAKEVEDRVTCVTVGVNKQYWNGRDDAAGLIRAMKGVTPSARATSKDTERLDWLEMFDVEVRTPLVHGSHHLFYACPDMGDGDETPSNLRKQIDYQRKGGDKP